MEEEIKTVEWAALLYHQLRSRALRALSGLLRGSEALSLLAHSAPQLLSALLAMSVRPTHLETYKSHRQLEGMEDRLIELLYERTMGLGYDPARFIKQARGVTLEHSPFRGLQIPLPNALDVSSARCCKFTTDDLCTVSYQDSGDVHDWRGTAGVVRSNHRIPGASLEAYYFEVIINQMYSDDLMEEAAKNDMYYALSVGLQRAGTELHGPGMNNISISAVCKFHFTRARNCQALPIQAEPWQAGDVIGCGWRLENSRKCTVFFTRNGKLITGGALMQEPEMKEVMSLDPNTRGDWYPVVCLDDHGVEVSFNFGQEPFRYDFTGSLPADYRRRLEEKTKNADKAAPVSEAVLMRRGQAEVLKSMMGEFPLELCELAMERNQDNMEQAADWLLSNGRRELMNLARAAHDARRQQRRQQQRSRTAGAGQDEEEEAVDQQPHDEDEKSGGAASTTVLTSGAESIRRWLSGALDANEAGGGRGAASRGGAHRRHRDDDGEGDEPEEQEEPQPVRAVAGQDPQQARHRAQALLLQPLDREEMPVALLGSDGGAGEAGQSAAAAGGGGPAAAAAASPAVSSSTEASDVRDGWKLEELSPGSIVIINPLVSTVLAESREAATLRCFAHRAGVVSRIDLNHRTATVLMYDIERAIKHTVVVPVAALLKPSRLWTDPCVDYREQHPQDLARAYIMIEKALSTRQVREVVIRLLASWPKDLPFKPSLLAGGADITTASASASATAPTTPTTGSPTKSSSIGTGAEQLLMLVKLVAAERLSGSNAAAAAAASSASAASGASSSSSSSASTTTSVMNVLRERLAHVLHSEQASSSSSSSSSLASSSSSSPKTNSLAELLLSECLTHYAEAIRHPLPTVTAQTAHPYPSSTTINRKVTIPGATKLMISFDPRSALAGDVMTRLTFYRDAARLEVVASRGERGNFAPVVMDGDRFWYKFTSGANPGSQWGYKFTVRPVEMHIDERQALASRNIALGSWMLDVLLHHAPLLVQARSIPSLFRAVLDYTFAVKYSSDKFSGIKQLVSILNRTRSLLQQATAALDKQKTTTAAAAAADAQEEEQAIWHAVRHEVSRLTLKSDLQEFEAQVNATFESAAAASAGDDAAASPSSLIEGNPQLQLVLELLLTAGAVNNLLTSASKEEEKVMTTTTTTAPMDDEKASSSSSIPLRYVDSLRVHIVSASLNASGAAAAATVDVTEPIRAFVTQQLRGVGLMLPVEIRAISTWIPALATHLPTSAPPATVTLSLSLRSVRVGIDAITGKEEETPMDATSMKIPLHHTVPATSPAMVTWLPTIGWAGSLKEGTELTSPSAAAASYSSPVEETDEDADRLRQPQLVATALRLSQIAEQGYPLMKKGEVLVLEQGVDSLPLEQAGAATAATTPATTSAAIPAAATTTSAAAAATPAAAATTSPAAPASSPAKIRVEPAPRLLNANFSVSCWVWIPRAENLPKTETFATIQQVQPLISQGVWAGKGMLVRSSFHLSLISEISKPDPTASINERLSIQGLITLTNEHAYVLHNPTAGGLTREHWHYVTLQTDGRIAELYIDDTLAACVSFLSGPLRPINPDVPILLGGAPISYCGVPAPSLVNVPPTPFSSSPDASYVVDGTTRYPVCNTRSVPFIDRKQAATSWLALKCVMTDAQMGVSRLSEEKIVKKMKESRPAPYAEEKEKKKKTGVEVEEQEEETRYEMRVDRQQWKDCLQGRYLVTSQPLIEDEKKEAADEKKQVLIKWNSQMDGEVIDLFSRVVDQLSRQRRYRTHDTSRGAPREINSLLDLEPTHPAVIQLLTQPTTQQVTAEDGTTSTVTSSALLLANLLGSFPCVSHVPWNGLVNRFRLLQLLNTKLGALLPFVDLTQAESSWSLAHRVVTWAPYLFAELKAPRFLAVLNATEQGMGISVRVDMARAIRARERKGDDVDGLKSVFGQLYRQVNFNPPSALRTKNSAWRVTQVGPDGVQLEGVDAGGLWRDSLTQLSNDLMSSATPLFIQCPNGRREAGDHRDKFIPNPAATSQLHISMFTFVGKLLGLSIRGRHALDLNIAPLFWKGLLQAATGARSGISRADIEAVDEGCFTLYDQLSAPRSEEDWNRSDLHAMELMFEAVGSDGCVVELKANGRSVPVTWSNRDEYLRLYLSFRLNEFEGPLAAIRRGLSMIVPFSLLRLFTPRDVEFMICGAPEIDIDYLRTHTDYAAPFSASDAYIESFWSVLASWDHGDRRKLIRFVWGRNRLPLKSSDWSQRFRIQPIHSRSSSQDGLLPVSHTCFFSIELPRYSTTEILRQRLLYAVHNCQTVAAF